MDAKERATEFVRRYPNLFTEDKDFWIEAIGMMIIEAQKAQLEQDKQMVLEILGRVRA